MTHSPSRREFRIAGKAKRRVDWLALCLLCGYFPAMLLLFPPTHQLGLLLWAYCAAFFLLAACSPRWWLWGAVFTICTLGFVPHLYGVFGKEAIDGSLFSVAHMPQVLPAGLKGRVISLPLLGLPPGLLLWWLREREVIVPRPFVPIAAFCAVTVLSCCSVLAKYFHVTFTPFDIAVIVPAVFDHLPYAREWWRAGMPYTLLTFTLTTTFAVLAGSMFLLAASNLSRRMDIRGTVFSALTLSTLVCVAYGLAQVKGLVPVFTPLGDNESTFQSQGSYGVFVGISCVLLFGRFVLAGKRAPLYGVLLGISLLGLFVNQTRSALFALAMSPFVIYAGYVLLRRRGVLVMKTWQRAVIVLLLAGTLTAACVLSVPQANRAIRQNCGNHFIQRITKTFDLDRGFNDISSGRLQIWAACVDVWREKPLLGCGQGQLYWELKVRGIPDSAANQFLLVLAELGAVGFGVFLWAVFSIFRTLAGPVVSPRGDYDYPSWLVCLALAVCLLLQSLTVHVLHFPNLPLLLGVVTAVVLSSSEPRPGPMEKGISGAHEQKRAAAG